MQQLVKYSKGKPRAHSVWVLEYYTILYILLLNYRTHWAENHLRKEFHQNIYIQLITQKKIVFDWNIISKLCLIVTFYWTCNVSFQIHRSKIVIQKIVMIPLVVHCCIREKWWGSDYPPLNKSLFWEKSKEQTYFLLVLIIFYTLLSASFWDEILHYALCLSK